MVFQQYNLWPHLTVIENLIEAPQKVLGISEEEAKKDALELLKRLRLEEHADRFPLHLSGGQQQRVAIVTHEVNVAQKVATKVVYMEQGKIIEMGSADCFDNPKTEQFKQYLSHSE